MVLITRSGTDKRVREEAERNRQIRRQEDVHKGLTLSKDAQRGDFKLCRENDKLVTDYIQFKNPKDREKIQREMDCLKQDYQNKGR